MLCGKGQCFWPGHYILVVMCLIAVGQVRSQVQISEHATTEIPRRAIHFVNGPTGISVEELHHRAGGFRDHVNGPTGTSVDAVEGRPPEGVEFMSGPTGISVAEEEQRQEEEEEALKGEREKSDGEVPGSIAPVGEIIGHSTTATSTSTSVSGPTLTSVAVQGEVRSDEGGRTSSRGVISTDPINGPGITQLPPGPHIDTTDWSRDSGLWSYTGGEWALVNLPDQRHTDIPTTNIPGKALVVVTNETLKKVYVTRVFRGLTNVTLHYSFFLSEGVEPQGAPELKVWQVTENTVNLLKTESSRGAWSDTTIHLDPESDEFTIKFEGRLMTQGNEIALDDITIRGNSVGGLDIARTENPQDNTTQETPLESTQVYDEDGTEQGGNFEGETENVEGRPTENENMQENLTTTPETNEEIGANITEPGEVNTDYPITENYDNSTGENIEGGSTEPGELQTTELNVNGTLNTTDIWGNGTEISTGQNNTTDEVLSPGTTEETNQTSIGNIDVTTDEFINNVTQSTPEINTTLPITPEQTNMETTQGKTTANVVRTSIQPSQTGGHIETTLDSNFTGISSGVPTDNTTGNGTTDAPVVMPEAGTTSSWRVFQIFLVLCLIGMVALGFLYWRKKRRQDDEIPMFTRSSHSDYHNPTFTADDDGSFVSRGGGSRHNYKSFE